MSNIDQKIAKNVLHETIYRIYIDELLKWNKKINLIGRTTEQQILERHIKDSEQLCALIEDKNSKIADFGSGAGFPGIVMAINGFKQMSLIEVDRKKCNFLDTIARKCNVRVNIINERIEDLPFEQYDYIIARAFASIIKIVEYGKNLIDNRTRLILLKGITWQQELDEMAKKYSFCHKIIDSKSQVGAKIIEIWDIWKKEQ